MLWSAAGAGAAILSSLEVEACNGCGFSFGNHVDSERLGAQKAGGGALERTC